MGAPTNQSDKQRAADSLPARDTAKGSWRSIASSLRIKVLLAFVFVSLVPLVILTLFNYVATRQALTHSANQALFAAASQTAAQLDAVIAADLAIIGAESKLPGLARCLRSLLGGCEQAPVLDILRSFSQKNPIFISSFALLDLQGRNLVDTDVSGVDGNESGREYFQAALETGLPYVSSVEFSASDGRAYLYFSSAVADAAGKPLGVLRARYGAAFLQQLVVQDNGLVGASSYPVLLDESGLILADGFSSPGSPSSMLYKAASSVGLAESLVLVDSPAPYFFLQRSGSNVADAAAVTRMKMRPWLVAFLEPQDALLASAWAQARDSSALAAIIVLLVAIVAIGAARLLTNPIVRLTDVARQVAGGNLDARAEIESNDEIGILAQAFNSMTSRLNASIGSLEQRVTELDLASSALRLSSERLQLATRVASIGIWDWDIPENELVWDDSMYQLYGIRRGDFGGAYDAWIGAIHPEDKAYTDGEIQAALRGEHEYAPEFRIVRPDGSIRYIKADAQTFKDQDGKPLRMIGTNIDITERKETEAELRNYKDQLEETVQRRTAELLLARDAAEAANKAKSVFLANMSHELRTPLNAILGFSSLIRRDPQLSQGLRENVEVINRSGAHLLTLINDVLEIAKIEAGRVQLESAPFDLGALLRDVVDMMHLRASEKGLRLQIDQSSDFPRYIKGDEARLRQILINLVGNAVKFTKEGGVVVRLGVRRNDMLHLLIEVEDSGPGISAEDQKRLFKPFVQLAEGGAQKGTGLGLAITRQFAELMKGTISVESVLGRGAVFRVDLPVEPVEAGSVPILADVAHGEVVGLAAGQPHYRVLIAEDQHENQLLLSWLMSDIGVEARVADDGVQCVKLFQEWQPDLIWMDRRMPVMEGEEATRRIRQLPGGDKVKIVAVTASVFKEEQQEMLDAGMDDLIRKPYRPDEIYDCFAKLLNVKYCYSALAAAKAASEPLTAAMLLKLPAPLRQELRTAVASLDNERIASTLDKLGAVDAELARTLSRLTEYFDYPAILKALDETDGQPEGS